MNKYDCAQDPNEPNRPWMGLRHPDLFTPNLHDFSDIAGGTTDRLLRCVLVGVALLTLAHFVLRPHGPDSEDRAVVAANAAP